MPKSRANPRLIKLHRAYTVEEAALLLGKHKNTLRAWIKLGLPVLTAQRPALILGSDLRTFLEARRKRSARPCCPGTIYCFKCRAPKRPAGGMVDYVPSNASGGNLKALCESCGTVMNRRIALAEIGSRMPGVDVQIREA